MLRYAPISDVRLLASLASGATSSLSALYDRYQARVFGAALAICRDEAVAAEASLRTFMWVHGQAARLSRCRPEVIGQVIELQAVAFVRQRGAMVLRDPA